MITFILFFLFWRAGIVEAIHGDLATISVMLDVGFGQGSIERMNSAMDDMNMIQQAQRHHHLVVREIGEEIDLEIGPGDDDPSFSGAALIRGGEASGEDHDEGKHMVMVSSQLAEDQDSSKMKRKKKVVKRWREEWADTYKWAYVDLKEGSARIFCSVCREYGRKHRRNPYGNEGSRNMQMSALEEHNNSLLHKEALRLQMASKDKIVVDKPIYVKGISFFSFLFFAFAFALAMSLVWLVKGV